ncbi:MAG: ABC transporter substrate-binding protein, partial [Sedimentibacter sp.]
VIAMMAVAITGCSGASTTGDSAATNSNDTKATSNEVTPTEKKDSIVIAVSSDILSMDPYRYNETPTNQFMLHIYETLISFDNKAQVHPGLAEKWSIADDGVTYTFNLKQGVKFHDGDEFTAEDVIASFNVAKNPDSPSAFSNFFSNVESYEATDDYTVVVKTKGVYPILLSDLSNIYILKKENVEGKTEEEIADTIIGTGRYKFVEQVKEDHIDLVANSEHWSGEKPITNVRFRPITNEATRTATMLTGEVDITVDISVRDVERLNDTEGMSVITQQGLREIYLNFDSRKDSPFFKDKPNPMADKKVREAMYRAIDVETIVKNIMNNYATVMNSYIPENYNGYKVVERSAYDPELSKQLLAEAGYPDGFEITLDASNDRYVNDGDIAQAVAGYLEKIGIKVNLNLMPKANFFSYIKPKENQSMFLMTGWSDSSGEGLTLVNDLLYTYDLERGVGTVNRGHYSNTEVDALIDKASREMDAVKRAEYVSEADRVAREDFGYIPLHYEHDTYAVKDGINFTPRMNKYIEAWKITID